MASRKGRAFAVLCSPVTEEWLTRVCVLSEASCMPRQTVAAGLPFMPCRSVSRQASVPVECRAPPAGTGGRLSCLERTNPVTITARTTASAAAIMATVRTPSARSPAAAACPTRASAFSILFALSR
ncbi:hypothetical protein [Streptomyces sp. MBT53]|uniref:hypothetical protein n=1 Tax=Streptomyces sp. MBT53 TaxID=1488384 RepID=UPI001F307DD3|nr:hypothetical protein [Streptomyces sp. MBT53]